MWKTEDCAPAKHNIDLSKATEYRRRFLGTGDPSDEDSMDDEYRKAGFSPEASGLSEEERAQLRRRYHLNKAAEYSRLFQETGYFIYESWMDDEYRKAGFSPEASGLSAEERAQLRRRYHLNKAAEYSRLFQETGYFIYESWMDDEYRKAGFSPEASGLSEEERAQLRRRYHLNMAAENRRRFLENGDPSDEIGMDESLEMAGYAPWVSEVSAKERAQLRRRYYLHMAAKYRMLFRKTGTGWYRVDSDEHLGKAGYIFAEMCCIALQNRKSFVKNIRWNGGGHEGSLPEVLVAKVCVFLEDINPLEIFERRPVVVVPADRHGLGWSGADQNTARPLFQDPVSFRPLFRNAVLAAQNAVADQECFPYIPYIALVRDYYNVIRFRGGRKNHGRAGRGERAARRGAGRGRRRIRDATRHPKSTGHGRRR